MDGSHGEAETEVQEQELVNSKSHGLPQRRGTGAQGWSQTLTHERSLRPCRDRPFADRWLRSMTNCLGEMRYTEEKERAPCERCPATTRGKTSNKFTRKLPTREEHQPHDDERCQEQSEQHAGVRGTRQSPPRCDDPWIRRDLFLRL